MTSALVFTALAVASEADAPRLGFLLWFRREGRGVAGEGTAVLAVFVLAVALTIGAFASGARVRWPEVVANVAIKISLAVSVLFMLVHPGLPQFDAKSLTSRAIAYPVLAALPPTLYLARRRPGAYPVFVDLCWTFALTLDIVGNDLHWYGNWKHWDDTVHFVNSLPIMFILITGLLVLERQGKMRIGTAMAAIFALAIYTSLHGAWEMSEYLSDRYLGTELQPGGMEEATRNNISSMLGALVAMGLIAWWRVSGLLERGFVAPASALPTLSAVGERPAGRE